MTFLLSDDGSGAGEEEIDAMVKRGVRVDESKSGSGLGLSIVYSIVRAHGGDIFVESSLRRGTLVKIEIPVKKSKKS